MTVTVNVGQGGNNFSPNMVTIHVGDTVLWHWVSGFHSTTSGPCCTGNGMWDSGQHSGLPDFSFKFNSAGTFPYFCSVHTIFMTGTVQVNP